MDSKLEKIIKKINIKSDYIDEFTNAVLYDFNVNELKNTIEIIIQNDDDISYSFYNELKDKFEEYFDSKVMLYIKNDKGLSSHFTEYFNLIDNEIQIDIPSFSLIKSKTTFNGNTLTVNSVNEIEKEDFDNTLKKIKKELSKYGVSFNYKIFIDDNLRNEINKNIDEESEQIMNRPFIHYEPKKEVSSFPRRRKKIIEQ